MPRNPCLPARMHHARTTLLRLQSVGAKHNARIRLRYPHSHPVRAVVETHISGTINDLPPPIHVFAQRAEDAACIQDKSLGVDPLEVFTESMSEIVDDAREWAGDIAISAFATPPLRDSRRGFSWRLSSL